MAWHERWGDSLVVCSVWDGFNGMEVACCQEVLPAAVTGCSTLTSISYTMNHTKGFNYLWLWWSFDRSVQRQTRDYLLLLDGLFLVLWKGRSFNSRLSISVPRLQTMTRGWQERQPWMKPISYSWVAFSIRYAPLIFHHFTRTQKSHDWALLFAPINLK